MSPDQKVLNATLWERTSAKGNTYLSGFLGKARVIGFRGEPTADGTPTWDIYLTPGKEQEDRGSGKRESRSPTSSSRTGVQRWAPKSEAERPAADDRPFYDDPIDDIGGGL